MRRTLLGLLALIVLFPPPVACQTGRATVIVRDRSRLTVIVTPPVFTGEVGDTVTFTAVALDTISGDTIPSVFSWTSLDPVGVDIEQTSGLATLLQAGTYEVEAFVQTIVGMIIMQQQNDGSFREIFTLGRQAHYAATGIVPPRFELRVGEEANLCGYLEADNGMHFICDCEWSSSNPGVASVSTPSVNLCPTWEPGFPFPTAAIRLPSRLFPQAGNRIGFYPAGPSPPSPPLGGDQDAS